MTSVGNNSTGNDSDVSVNENISLETQDPKEPTAESDYFTDDETQDEESTDDSTTGIFYLLELFCSTQIHQKLKKVSFESIQEIFHIFLIWGSYLKSCQF